MKICNIQTCRKLSFIFSATHKIIFVCNTLRLLLARIGLMVPFLIYLLKRVEGFIQC